MKKGKANALQAALDRASISQSDATREPIRDNQPLKKQTDLSRKSTGRDGTVLIGGHFPKSVQTQLKILAAEEDVTHQDLLREALDLLFVKKGKRQIIEL